MEFFTHLAVGLLLAIPFVQDKEKLYFFVIGGIGAILPDIDLLISYLDHRSITHSFWFWLVITGLMLFGLIILNNWSSSLISILFLFQIAWLSHLILDFGFSQTWFFDFADITYTQGWFFNLPAGILSFINDYIAIPLVIGILFYYMVIKHFTFSS